MGFENKTYGLNLFNCSLFAIELQLYHLNVQGWLDPRGGLHCFWCPNKNLTLLLVRLMH